MWLSIFLMVRGFQWGLVWRLGWPWQGLDLVVLIHTLIDLAVWYGALSCWKIQTSNLVNTTVRTEWRKFSSRITLTWYVTCFMHPSQRQMCPNPALMKHPQIITDPLPNFTVGARHCGLWVSPGLHRTLDNQVLDKVENWTHQRRWPYSSLLRSNPYGLLQTSALLFFASHQWRFFFSNFAL